jgi:small subunit ribosomal protein S14
VIYRVLKQTTGMKNKINKDAARRLLAAKFEIKRMHYRAVIQDRNLPHGIRHELTTKLTTLPRNSSKTRIRNRCIVTGRPRSVYSQFRFSRIIFRQLASSGLIPGISKSSW